MTGEVEDYGKAGVHAWKLKRDAIALMVEAGGGVVGSVLLWGNVVEHERGYRAEFGKVRSLDYIDEWAIRQNGKSPLKDDACYEADAKLLAKLRENYLSNARTAAIEVEE